MLASAPAPAQRPSDQDREIVDLSRLRVYNSRIEIYQDYDSIRAVDPAFLTVVDRACQHIEALLGRKLDSAMLEPPIRIYVADFPGPSHVWRGDAHRLDPRAIVFVNRADYSGGLSGKSAGYARELTHLYAWRYSSHTLREGLGNYAALQIHPGARHPEKTPVEPKVLEYLGTTRTPTKEMMADERLRRAYEYASYRFVSFLIGRGGMETFLKLYDSAEPETQFQKLYGASRDELVRMAGI